ncbi:MAG: hypothetical protein HYY52_05530 [Candidatus Melainabacteria bacterium]|nr:hypothetical protein [Candidatus Melainabacteria bacterium]
MLKSNTRKLNLINLPNIIFCVFLLFHTLSTLGIGFKEEQSRSNIKAKINYLENPNKPDFFTSTEKNNYIELGNLTTLQGTWSGSFALDKSSIIWENHGTVKKNVYDLIKFGSYNILFNFYTHDNKLSDLKILQDEIKYGFVNVEVFNKSQINYWTKATSLDWNEIVRGKIFRINDNELFTIFQTTVYENKIPIYAFRGEAILSR